jgi:hypothetical protein
MSQPQSDHRHRWLLRSGPAVALHGYGTRGRLGGRCPELLRNENWNYAIFTTAKQYQHGVNQAECLACHKPLSDVSYTFTLKQLSTAK